MTWKEKKSYPNWDLNPDPSGIQPVASGYSDCTIVAQNKVAI
jgi:hypothetical protein